MNERQRRGAAAERRVAKLYEAEGYRVEARNWSCRGGELDLVLRREEVLVFVEVRSRSTEFLSSPTITVGLSKQRRVARAADAYLRRVATAEQIRFDVVGVSRRGVERIENAFAPPWAY